MSSTPPPIDLQQSNSLREDGEDNENGDLSLTLPQTFPRTATASGWVRQCDRLELRTTVGIIGDFVEIFNLKSNLIKSLSHSHTAEVTTDFIQRRPITAPARSETHCPHPRRYREPIEVNELHS